MSSRAGVPPIEFCGYMTPQQWNLEYVRTIDRLELENEKLRRHVADLQRSNHEKRRAIRRLRVRGMQLLCDLQLTRSERDDANAAYSDACRELRGER